jgi:hypothetical protein
VLLCKLVRNRLVTLLLLHLVGPSHQKQLFVVRSGLPSTAIGTSRFGSGYVDTYEPGTARERQYMCGLSSVYKDDCMEDTAKLADEAIENKTQDCIEVEVPSDWE